MRENIFEPTEFLRPFPAAAEVFAGPVERYARHLHPLLSIQLAAVDAGWNGWIHLVSPLEPCEGCIGDHTVPYHNYYLRSNWLAFRSVDDRYQLLGDFRYFYLENPADDSSIAEAQSRQRSELEAHYARQQTSFATMHARFHKHGALYRRATGSGVNGAYVEKDRSSLLDQLGGDAPGGNWETTSDFPVILEDGTHPRPVTEDGRPFHFVASVPAWHYRDSGADSILLFYDPPTRIALLTFDWT